MSMNGWRIAADQPVHERLDAAGARALVVDREWRAGALDGMHELPTGTTLVTAALAVTLWV